MPPARATAACAEVYYDHERQSAPTRARPVVVALRQQVFRRSDQVRQEPGGVIVGRLLTSSVRLLHPLRRRVARQTLQGRAPRSVLVVCHGNICRSPLAAALLDRALAGTGTQIRSAGFIGFNRLVPREAVDAAARRGIDLSDHRSSPLTPDLVRSADLIVVMEPGQQRQVLERFGRSARDVIVLGDLDPAPLQARTIRDPVNQPSEVFEQSYTRIERCVQELARILGSAGR